MHKRKSTALVVQSKNSRELGYQNGCLRIRQSILTLVHTKRLAMIIVSRVFVLYRNKSPHASQQREVDKRLRRMERISAILEGVAIGRGDRKIARSLSSHLRKNRDPARHAKYLT